MFIFSESILRLKRVFPASIGSGCVFFSCRLQVSGGASGCSKYVRLWFRSWLVGALFRMHEFRLVLIVLQQFRIVLARFVSIRVLIISTCDGLTILGIFSLSGPYISLCHHSVRLYRQNCLVWGFDGFVLFERVIVCFSISILSTEWLPSGYAFVGYRWGFFYFIDIVSLLRV